MGVLFHHLNTMTGYKSHRFKKTDQGPLLSGLRTHIDSHSLRDWKTWKCTSRCTKECLFPSPFSRGSNPSCWCIPSLSGEIKQIIRNVGKMPMLISSHAAISPGERERVTSKRCVCSSVTTGHKRQFNVYSTLVHLHFIEMTWKQRWFNQCVPCWHKHKQAYMFRIIIWSPCGHLKLVVYLRFKKASELYNFHWYFRLHFLSLIIIHIIIHISCCCRIIFLR